MCRQAHTPSKRRTPACLVLLRDSNKIHAPVDGLHNAFRARNLVAHPPSLAKKTATAVSAVRGVLYKTTPSNNAMKMRILHGRHVLDNNALDCAVSVTPLHFKPGAVESLFKCRDLLLWK